MKLAQIFVETPNTDWDQFFLEAQTAILKRFKTKYGNPACGRNRCVFSSKFVVIKVPMNRNGLIDNTHEYDMWKKQAAQGYTDAREIRYARSRIIYVLDIPLLVMQKLDIEHNYVATPDWADYVDCAQIGKDKRGIWRAYDFGYM